MAELGQQSYFMNPNSDDAKGNEGSGMWCISNSYYSESSYGIVAWSHWSMPYSPKHQWLFVLQCWEY